MFCVRKSVPTTSAVALAIVGAMGVAQAGENLSLEELAGRTVGTAVVHVDLQGEGTLKLIEILRGALPADFEASPSWTNLCLPRRRILRRWQTEHAKWAAKTLWRRALARGQYEAVVFIKKYDDGFRPHCGVEAMQMLHTDLHPDYAAYRAATAKVEFNTEPKE